MMNRWQLIAITVGITVGITAMIMYMYQKGVFPVSKTNTSITKVEQSDGAEIEMEEGAESFACSCGCSSGNEMKDCQCGKCGEMKEEKERQEEKYYYEDSESGEMVEIPIDTSVYKIMDEAAVDDIQESDIRLQDSTSNIEEKVIKNELEPNVKAELDAIFAKFSDLELFILIKEMGFFGEEVRKITAKELSYMDFFVQLAKRDKDGVNNISFGDVNVKRPRRNLGIKEEILVESVYYVKEKFYSNKVAKVTKKIAILSEKVSMDDLRGCLESYCLQLWKSRCE